MRTRISQRKLNNVRSINMIRCYWRDFDFDLLDNITIRNKSGVAGQKGVTYADCVMMADTETSKKTLSPVTEEDYRNHVCAWSFAVRAYGYNICMLWGTKPSEFVECLQMVREHLDADEIYLYFHNLSYDWVFLRKHLIQQFGFPAKQLNIKPLMPLYIKFANGIILKDSLALSQRSIAKWGEDLDVEHKKAVGKWDYLVIRNQDGDFSDDELTYISNDVLCGVECIDKTCEMLGKKIASLPLTATGIVRNEAREIGRAYHAHDWYLKLSPETYDEQLLLEFVYHGGYTHASRFILGMTIPGDIWTRDEISKHIICYDFSSSYPFCMLAYKYPAERFWALDREVDKEYILNNMEEYAFIFKACFRNLKLKNPRDPMPPLSKSKCLLTVNDVLDNGRILEADYAEIYLTEIDFVVIMEHYEADVEISDVRCAVKDYLPKWFTDYVYSRYESKTKLKGVDDVLYAIEKSKVNCLYGMTAQKPVKADIVEDYQTGVYSEVDDFDFDAMYDKHLKSRNSFLPYCIGIYVTAYAMRNLFTLGSCVPEGELWLYSDTDSVYATAFDEEKLKAYNDNCIKLLADRGYKGVEHKGKIYHLGVAEHDGMYMQFKTLHSKCYCKRPVHFDRKNKQYAIMDGVNGFVMGDTLKITVAGVPKKGAVSLQDDINNFTAGFIFPGTESGKKQHKHCIVDKIYIDDQGNEQGDSIDLSPCDYLLKGVNDIDYTDIWEDDVLTIDYEMTE